MMITRRAALLGAAGLLGWPARADTLVLQPRAAWGAADALSGGTEHRIWQVTLHHTAVAASAGQDTPARLRSYQAHHQRLGWVDIAYHVLIGPDGTLYQGRSALLVGDTATDYDPTGHFLVCLDGNFETQVLPEAQYRAAVDICAWACEAHRVPVERVSAHADHAHTVCPGRAVRGRLASFRRDVAARGTVGVRIPAFSPAPGSGGR